MYECDRLLSGKGPSATWFSSISRYIEDFDKKKLRDCQNYFVVIDLYSQFVSYTETEKFSNTLQIRIFITKIHVEVTQTE